MRAFRVLLLLPILVFVNGCADEVEGDNIGGNNVTRNFLEDYNGFYEEKSDTSNRGETILFERDGDIEVTLVRDVGEAGNPAIPQGTVCNYVLSGQLRYVVELDESNRTRVKEDESTYLLPQTHAFTFDVHAVTLSNEKHAGTTSDQGCKNFKANINAALPSYTYPMELFGSGNIRLHTTGEYDGGEVSQQVLDEVFVRQ